MTKSTSLRLVYSDNKESENSSEEILNQKEVWKTFG